MRHVETKAHGEAEWRQGSHENQLCKRVKNKRSVNSQIRLSFSMYSTPTKMQKGRHVKAAVHKTMKQSGFQQKSKRSAGP